MRARQTLLYRIAQAAATANVVPTTQSPTGSTAPIAPPPVFQASSVYPTIRTGWNGASVQAIDRLVYVLNMALHYGSNGAVNFRTLYNDNFNIDPSGIPSVDARNLALVSQLVYRSILNGGNQFTRPLTSTQIATIIQRIQHFAPLNALSQTNPTGAIALHIPGNLRDNLLMILQYLLNANLPATTTS